MVDIFFPGKQDLRLNKQLREALWCAASEDTQEHMLKELSVESVGSVGE